MPNDELSELIDDLERGYDGDAWHGPPLRKVLDGVTAEVASARPVADGHSIWEIVAHLAAWDGVVACRIAEQRAIEAPDAGDFPVVAESGPVAWEAAIAEMDRQHARLVEAVRRLEPNQLREQVVGLDYLVIGVALLPLAVVVSLWKAGRLRRDAAGNPG